MIVTCSCKFVVTILEIMNVTIIISVATHSSITMAKWQGKSLIKLSQWKWQNL